MAKISQYFKDKAKTIKDYPKTLMKAVYGDDGQRLDNVLSDMNSTMNEFGEYKGVSTVLSGTVSLKDTSLVSGHYVCDSVINGPDDTRLTGGYIDVEAHPNSAYRKVKFSPYGLNEWYVITCSGGTWSGWEKLVKESDIATQDGNISIPSGATADLMFCKKSGNVVTFNIRIYNINIPYGSTIFTLPKGFRPNSSIFLHCACKAILGGTTYYSGLFALNQNGEVKQEIDTGAITWLSVCGTFII